MSQQNDRPIDRPIDVVDKGIFGRYDRSRQSLPASITGKRGSRDPISFEGPEGMEMPVGHKGINGRATAPYYDLHTLAPWVDSNHSRHSMPHSREHASTGLRKLHAIEWRNEGRDGIYPHPDYNPQNTLDCLRILQNQYPLPVEGQGGAAALIPPPAIPNALLQPPRLGNLGMRDTSVRDSHFQPYGADNLRVTSMRRELLFLGDNYYNFRRRMSGLTREVAALRPDWLTDYWTYHRWSSDQRAPPHPQLIIPQVNYGNLQNHYRNRAHFRLRMAEKMYFRTPLQRAFRGLLCEYWIVHPFDFSNDDNDTARVYFTNINRCIDNVWCHFPEDFLIRHRQNLDLYNSMGRVLPPLFPDEP